MKKFFLILLTTILTLCIVALLGAGWFVGDYFVDYALKRGNDGSDLTPPPAYADFGSKRLKQAHKPHYKSENWQIQSKDGLRLQGTHFQPKKGSHKWVVLIHGYGGDQTYMWNMASIYLRHGYQVLTPDLRASGTSEGQYVTLGSLESKDLAEWCNKISQEDPKGQIALHGVSMGAATELLASANASLPNVKAIVEDSSYTNAYTFLLDTFVKNSSYPAKPILLCANIMTKIRTGVFFSSADPLTAVGRSQLPTLFIHGAKDKLVPPDMMEQLFNASSSADKKQLMVADAGHAMAYVKDSDLYFSTVFDFLDKNML